MDVCGFACSLAPKLVDRGSLGMELNREKFHQVFVVLQNIDLKLEALWMLVKNISKSIDENIAYLYAIMRKSLLYINSRMSHLIVDQAIDNSSINHILWDVANMRDKLFSDDQALFATNCSPINPYGRTNKKDNAPTNLPKS